MGAKKIIKQPENWGLTLAYDTFKSMEGFFVSFFVIFSQ